MTSPAAETRGPVDAAGYSALETLRDGWQVEIRAMRPTDMDGMKAAVARVSAKSLYRRFFGPKRFFSEKEAAHYVNVDFVTHVALVVVADDHGQPAIVGSGRYILVRTGAAEVAFTIVDEYQGRGLGSAILRHLIVIARRGGLTELVASVLPDNRPMLAVFEKSGLPVTTRREQGAVIVTLGLS